MAVHYDASYILEVCARVREARPDLGWDIVPLAPGHWARSNTVRVTGIAEHDAQQLILEVNS